MKTRGFVLATSLLLIQAVHAQERGAPCDKQTTAVALETKGQCSCRIEGKVRPLTAPTKLDAGQELQCNKKSSLTLRMCRTQRDIPIKENAPAWYIIPKVPPVRPIDDPTMPGGRHARFFSPPNPRIEPGGKQSSSIAFSILQRDRNPVEDVLKYGNQARNRSKYEDSIRAYQAVLDYDPTNARALYGLGNLYTDQHEWRAAERAYRAAFKLDSHLADALVALSFVLLQTEAGSASQSRIAEAEMLARRAIDLQPFNAAALDLVGVALEARASPGGEVEAERLYRRAIQMDRRNVSSYLHLSDSLRKTGRSAEAETYLELGVNMARGVPALLLVAQKLFANERYAESQKPLRRLLKHDSRNHAAHYLLGQALAATGKHDKAIAPLKSAIKENPDSFAAYEALVWAYLELNRPKKAEEVLGAAMSLKSINDNESKAIVLGLVGIGDGYNNNGALTDALRSYERAAKIDPDNLEIQRRLTSLRELIR